MSSDPVDAGCEREQQDRELSIHFARMEAHVPKQVFDHCTWCGEPTLGGDQFCSYGAESCAIDAKRFRSIRAKQVAQR